MCEADCKILDTSLFQKRLKEALDVLDSTKYPMVKFEAANEIAPTQFNTQVSKNIWECDQVLPAHCYLINKNSKLYFDNLYNTFGWHAFDWWIVFAFQETNIKMLGFKEKFTSQFDGFSEIDKIEKVW